MTNRVLVDDWIRVHRQLMEQEVEFTNVAIKAAQGEVPVAQLDEARARLLGMRDLCNAVYAKTFPHATGEDGAAREDPREQLDGLTCALQHFQQDLAARWLRAARRDQSSVQPHAFILALRMQEGAVACLSKG